MSNVIDFLERLGQDADLRHASGSELADALAAARIDGAVRDSILRRDESRGLEALVGAKPNVCCGIAAPTCLDDEVNMHNVA